MFRSGTNGREEKLGGGPAGSSGCTRGDALTIGTETPSAPSSWRLREFPNRVAVPACHAPDPGI